MSKMWEPIFSENEFINNDFTKYILDEVVVKYKKPNDFEYLARQLNIEIECLIHAVAHLMFHFGKSDISSFILSEYLSTNSDEKLHSLYLKVLMSTPYVTYERYYNELVEWNRRYLNNFQNNSYLFTQHRSVKNRKPCIGFVCTYANTFIYKIMFEPILEYLVNNGYEVKLVSITHPSGSFRSTIYDEVFIIRPFKNNISDAICENKIDILIDITGRFRYDNPIQTYLNKPAPVQISWGNMFATYNIPQIGYIISDENMIPSSHEKFYSEKIFRLNIKSTSTIKLDKQIIHNSPTIDNPNLFVLASFNALFKLNDLVLETWIKILSKAPKSILFIMHTGATNSFFINRVNSFLAKYSISGERVLFSEGINFYDMIKLYDKIDLCLNPFPYSAGSTALISLAKGIPTITLATDNKYLSPSGGDVIYRNLGLMDFVANDVEEYIDKATYYANNIKLLNSIRLSMNSLIAESPYFKTDLFSSEFTDVCNKIWLDHINTNQ